MHITKNLEGLKASMVSEGVNTRVITVQTTSKSRPSFLSEDSCADSADVFFGTLVSYQGD